MNMILLSFLYLLIGVGLYLFIREGQPIIVILFWPCILVITVLIVFVMIFLAVIAFTLMLSIKSFNLLLGGKNT